ncbi:MULTISPECIES: hypothetical protein [Actinomycetes]|uniref:hypothetical protein n=1 Tax=Actinomycetes TaxID=1760 RepID=UPI003424025E
MNDAANGTVPAEAVSCAVPLAELPAWQAPQPSDLPEWRAQMHAYLGTSIAAHALGSAMEGGQASVVPFIEGLNAPPAEVAGQLLARSERQRLEQAQLYYATADMTSLALAAAAEPPTEPVRAARLPSPYGLIVFAEPIGGYRSRTRPDAADVTVPIVAASWGRWTPRTLTVSEGPITWTHLGRGSLSRIPDDMDGIWITFYSPDSSAGYADMDPAAVVGTDSTGQSVTAGELASFRSPFPTPLGWDNEMIYGIGHPFTPPEPDTIAQWGQIVYTAWQLITQGGSKLIEAEEVERPRSGRKRDSRQGITGPLHVQVVNVHSSHRPSAAAAAEDAAASTGRTAPQYSCRWPVRMHRRDHCMNTRAHGSGDCTHEERIILPYVKGPQGAPLRVRDRVNLWDHQPDVPAPRCEDGQ